MLIRKVALSAAAALVVLAGTIKVTSVGCPELANRNTARGWSLLEDGANEDARLAFTRANQTCPDHLGARSGLGYAALRLGDDGAAARLFGGVLAASPNDVDALVGQGLIAWRAGDLQGMNDLLQRALSLDPGRQDALAYLAELPEGFGPPPDRLALALPDTLEHRVRANGGRFEVNMSPSGWQPFYVKGVNLGAAVPGRYASEFPDSATYAGWLAEMSEMGANTVRLYTIHPPAFYKALHDHNAQADSPLWLVHGVWAELPPGDDYDDPTWLGGFVQEMRDVVDVLHGRADIRPRPGHASGHYVADVSRWTLAYVIGREWEPYSVQAFNELRPERASWAGRYLTMDAGTPMDAWLAMVCDEIVLYESETYRVQRPVAYTNWPTLDPLHHPTEATFAEEARIREGFGEVVGAVSPGGYQEDAVTLDPSLVRATDAFPAGYFAAYHVYPYYPDFMVLSPEYRKARSPFGASSYFGYLEDLKAHHHDLPVLIAEYGVPTSLGVSHMQPNGWHHGGHDELDMARIAERMTVEIAAAGMAGGVVFAWIDEWFKKNWLTQDFTLPADRNRLWLNLLDPEQQYGVLAMEPEPRIPGETLGARLPGWRRVAPLYSDPSGARVRALADEAALHLLIEPAIGRPVEEVLVGFDVDSPEAGSLRWPGGVGPPVPAAVDFVLRVSGEGARLLASPVANPFDLLPDTVGQARRGTPARLDFVAPPSGLFQERVRQSIGVSRPAAVLNDGRYDSLRVLTNGLRFGRDGTEYRAIGYDRGVLPEGPAPDGFWEWSLDGSALEVRIPWMLLNVTDPSSRTAVRLGAPAANGELATVEIAGIRVVAALRREDGAWQALPGSGRSVDVALFSWPGWEEPRWTSRRRPAFDALRRAFHALDDNLVTTEWKP